MNILSLFDGISCGQLALQRTNINVSNYYASEIDKYAIQITQKNFPNTIQLGDVNNIDFNQFTGKIDLLIGGSPCQDLSIAKKDRKGLEGSKSNLFYKFFEALEIIKPKYFLLENVAKMPKQDKQTITDMLGVEPILIDSGLVSAQERKRLYWTNISNILQPNNKKIYLKDIIEYGFYNGNPCEDRIKMQKTQEKVKVRKYPVDVEKLKIVLREHKTKSGLTIKNISDKLNVNKTTVEHWFRTDNCFSIPEEDIWFELKELLHIDTDEFDKPITVFEIRDSVFDMSKRVYQINGKAPTLTTITGGQQKKIIDDNYQIRELTPLECERLQTLPDNYTEGVSPRQRYRAIGNGWTVDVITHIFSFIEN